MTRHMFNLNVPFKITHPVRKSRFLESRRVARLSSFTPEMVYQPIAGVSWMTSTGCVFWGHKTFGFKTSNEPQME